MYIYMCVQIVTNFPLNLLGLIDDQIHLSLEIFVFLGIMIILLYMYMYLCQNRVIYVLMPQEISDMFVEHTDSNYPLQSLNVT